MSTHHSIFSVLLIVLVVLSPGLLPVAGAAKSAPAASSASDGDDFHLTLDVSASTGSSNNVNYSEIGLGVNAFFAKWLVWRNAGFARFRTGSDTLYGLDTSARAVLELGDAKMGLTAFVGPGYRFTLSGNESGSSTTASSQPDSAPFAEAGIVAHAGGLHIGGGAKTIFNSAVRSGTPDDTQYFLILGGGATL